VYTPTPTHYVLLLQVVLALGTYTNAQCHVCIGGKSVGEDIRRLEQVWEHSYDA
jgi:hypothetical protein